MNTRLPACVLLLAGTIACSAPPPPPAAPAAPPPPPPIDLAAGDIAKVGSGYSEDAVLVSPRGKVDTRAAIAAFWTEALKTPGAGKNLKLETVKVGSSGDLAYVLSRFTGGITAPSGHVLGIVQRQADGSLKTIAQMTVPDPPRK
jgi:ketosteroid isomerase-like protein